MKTLAIIPARAGSKGVPRKNVHLLAGKPLIAYTIEAAKESNAIYEIFITTDDPEVVTVARSAGVDVPFLRPSELADDKASMFSVIKHVLDHYKLKSEVPETIVLLQPTCPFRTAQDIDEALNVFKDGDYDSVISVVEVPHKFNPYWVYLEMDSGNLRLFNGGVEPITRRQDLPKSFIREGSIYIFSTDTLERFNNIYGEKIGFYLIKRKTINIDTMEDFQEAEKLLLSNLKER